MSLVTACWCNLADITTSLSSLQSMSVMACVYRAAAVIATDKEDLVERVKEITGVHCYVRRGKK